MINLSEIDNGADVLRNIIFAAFDTEFDAFHHLKTFWRETDDWRRSKKEEFYWFVHPKFKMQEHDMTVTIRLRMRKTQINVKMCGIDTIHQHFTQCSCVICFDILNDYVKAKIFKRKVFPFINAYFEVNPDKPYRVLELTNDLPSFFTKDDIETLIARFDFTDNWISIPSYLFEKPHDLIFISGPIILNVNVKVHETDALVTDTVIHIPRFSNFRVASQLKNNTVEGMLEYMKQKWEDVIDNDEYTVTYIGKDGCLVDGDIVKIMGKHFGEFCYKAPFDNSANVYLCFDIVRRENFGFDLLM